LSSLFLVLFGYATALSAVVLVLCPSSPNSAIRACFFASSAMSLLVYKEWENNCA
jgi:hypothetical protein